MNDLSGMSVRLGRRFPRPKIVHPIALTTAIDMRRILKLGMQIQNIFPAIRSQSSHGINIELAIATVRGINLVAPSLRFPAQNCRERSPINVLWRPTAAQFNQSRQNIDP